MKIIDEMPKTGQFNVMWVYKGVPYAETWRWNDQTVEIIIDVPSGDDQWITNDCYYEGGYSALELMYVVVE